MGSVYARLAAAKARNFELLNAKMERDEAIELSLTDEFHVFPFFASVDSSSVPKAIGVLDMWSRKDPGCDMTVVFCSPGGTIVDGLALFDFLKELQERGHKVTTKVMGQAASMGAVLMQAGSERIASPHAFFHVHTGSEYLEQGTRLSTGALEDSTASMKKYNDMLFDILSERSTLTRKQIEARAKRKEWLMTAEEAVEYGFIDRIGF